MLFVKLFTMVERNYNIGGTHTWRVIDQVDLVGIKSGKDMSSLTIKDRFTYDSGSMM